MKKLFISVLLLIFIGFITFCFIGSGGMVSEAEYYQVKTYDMGSAYAHSDVHSDTLTVMTFNLGYLSGMTNNLPIKREYDFFRKNMEKAILLVNNIHPDILGLQEIDFHSSRSFYQNQLDSLAIHAGFGYSYRSVNWDKRYVPFPYWPVQMNFGEMLSGQAILSRFPIHNDSTVKLIKPLNSCFFYDAFYLERLVQICDVEIGPVIVKVMNLHLEAFDEETREKQAFVVKDIYEEYSREMPVLLIGDFNSKPANEKEQQKAMEIIMQADNIASAVDDSTYAGAPEAYYTFSSGDPYQMIDYILYNTNYLVKTESRVVKEAGQISDHLPLLMKFTFK